MRENGYEALRIEDLVRAAGVAKGTFFAHFKDKDALMDRLIGDRIDAELDRMEALPVALPVAGMVGRLLPLLAFMTRERYIFEVILRHSGAATPEEIGPIAVLCWPKAFRPLPSRSWRCASARFTRPTDCVHR